uniref:Uncharacterized protein n=1 Tax=Sphaerodactylus townsendi TaxID=933632 RepID=A0ACB8FWV7_9SAUR
MSLQESPKPALATRRLKTSLYRTARLLTLFSGIPTSKKLHQRARSSVAEDELKVSPHPIFFGQKAPDSVLTGFSTADAGLDQDCQLEPATAQEETGTASAPCQPATWLLAENQK